MESLVLVPVFIYLLLIMELVGFNLLDLFIYSAGTTETACERRLIVTAVTTRGDHDLTGNQHLLTHQ